MGNRAQYAGIDSRDGLENLIISNRGFFQAKAAFFVFFLATSRYGIPISAAGGKCFALT